MSKVPRVPSCSFPGEPPRLVSRLDLSSRELPVIVQNDITGEFKCLSESIPIPGTSVGKLPGQEVVGRWTGILVLNPRRVLRHFWVCNLGHGNNYRR